MTPMKLGRTSKVLVGLATLWPIVYMFLFFGFIFTTVFLEGFRSGRGTSDGPPKWFFVIFALHFLTILWMFGLLAFYMVYLYRTDRVAQDKKALWAVVLFLGNLIAMPIFFYLYVWREPPAPPPSAP